ncbi:mitochondrial carrier [Viridothelium virens]|uniref:Mitochondrial carrier n=1 Tax=Viridothelium virens TaxID=1048519 RepID=A0A6A6H2S8_VIRVR|nr:mitochondrial carrier [Viridothelium virens]
MAHIYNSQLDAFCLYHKVREEEEETTESQSTLSSLTPALPALGEALSGATGTALSHLLIYPLDLVITRLQVQQRQHQQQKTPSENSPTSNAQDRQYYANILDAFRRIYEDEGGISAFYTGVVEDTAKSIADSFLFFLAYTFIRRTRQRQRKGALPIVDELLVGMAAGAFAKLLTTPVQNIVTRKQTAALETQPDIPPTKKQADETAEAQTTKPVLSPSSHPTHQSTPSTTHIAHRIHAEKGLLGFWSGYSASLILTLNPALTFLLHSLLSRLLLRTRRRAPGPGPATNNNKSPALSPRLTFLVAALSKAVASTCTYPIGLAKARAQARGAATAAERRKAKEKEARRFLAPFASYEGWHERTEYRSGGRTGLRVPRVLVPRVLQTVVGIARVEGVGAVYSGLGGEVLKGFLGHGLTMLLKQRVHVSVVALWGLVVRMLGVLRREGRVG